MVVDGANGSASYLGPKLFRSLGAEVTSIHCSPDGRNINDRCGATHTSSLQQAVVAHGADLGLAFDGDGDRVLAVDHTGAVIDGDRLIAMAAIHLREQGALHHDTVVVTVMSNLGFHRLMEDHGIRVLTTDVGDRYVLEHMRERGYNVGGEASGHIILSDYATTGDGLVAALQVLAVVKKLDQPVSKVCHRFEPLPQIMKNVRYKTGKPLENVKVQSAITAAEKKLNGQGRLVIRPSGTEPVIR